MAFTPLNNAPGAASQLSNKFNSFVVITMGVFIKAIEYALPEQIVTNSDYEREFPDWNMSLIAPKTGVYERHIAAENETALTFAKAACDKLFLTYDKSGVDAIIFCTQSPDYIMPPNSYLLHQYLGLPANILAFDFNQACSGFIYGLVLAKSLLLSGTAKNVLLITGDTYSKYINKKDRSTRVLFGDGAAATLISADENPKGMIDHMIDSEGSKFDQFYIKAGGSLIPRSETTAEEVTDRSGNVRTDNDIYMNGMGVLSFFQSMVPRQIKSLLKKNELAIEKVDLFVFHQASKLAMNAVSHMLKLPEEKVFSNIAKVGNTVSASIPIACKDAMDAGLIKEGSTVVFSGFGVGLSWGSVLYRF